jgi:UDP-N-acetylglucosamine 2-epimerase (hydrolysing)
MNKKIVFLTGTRADFGKLKPLINKVENSLSFKNYIFVTGMHTLSKYGSTYREVEKEEYKNIYKYINQSQNTKMDIILSNTILGFSNYVNEINPDLIVVHGDRLEALAGAIVGAMNNILVAHIEGGEISGTIDEVLRHSITKLSHIHFVANNEAKNRVKQLGESDSNVFVIGSPDIDIMLSEDLPSLTKVKDRYDIDFNNYAICIYHPVTTELDELKKNIKEVVLAIEESKENFVIIYPNNDEGSNIILNEYDKLSYFSNVKIFPSIRFEYFLKLLKESKFIMGNSSSGIREAEVYAVPTINIGTRQDNRSFNKEIINVSENKFEILRAIEKVKSKKITSNFNFGKGESAKKFFDILSKNHIWRISPQKTFIDINDF